MIMRYYPIVALSNARHMVAVIEGANAEERAARLVKDVNRHAGDAVVKLGKAFDSDVTGVFYVGDRAVPVNPSYAVRRDPNRLQLSALAGDAREANAARAAKTGAAATAGTGAAAKPRTRTAKTTAKTTAGTRSTRTRAKAGTSV